MVRPGRVMFELEGVTPEIAAKAMALAAAKLSVRSKLVDKGGGAHQCLRNSRWRTFAMSVADIQARVAELEEERFRLQFRSATETLDDPLRLRWIRRNVARLKTSLYGRAGARRMSGAAGWVRTHGRRGERPAAARAPRPRMRKTRVGTVVSDKMQKTVVVAIERRLPHPVYGKMITRTKHIEAADQDNASKAGDTVRVMETRPISKDKRWHII